jgi:predicted dehydrogenase
VWIGEIESVSATLAQVGADRPDAAEDTFTVLARTERGAVAVLQQTAAAWGPPAGLTRVVGTTGALWLDESGVHVADRSGVERLETPADLRLAEAPGESDDPRHRFTHLELGPYTRLCEVLRAGVEGGPLPDTVPPPAFADGLACMRVLDAVRDSAAAGGARRAVTG